MRICSFLPAVTEIIYALGLEESLYGVTHECDYPKGAMSKPIVLDMIDHNNYSSESSQWKIDRRISESVNLGHGLYQINLKILKEIKPDIIFTQELCNVCSIAYKEVLKTVHEVGGDSQVISMAPRGLDGVLEAILKIGEATGTQDKAEKLTLNLRERILTVKSKTEKVDSKSRVFCAEWLDPIYCSGHWIPEMIEFAGGIEGLGIKGADARKIKWNEVISYNPEVIIMMPCGYDVEKTVSQGHLLLERDDWKELQAVKDNRVYATNANWYYSRPGPRLVDGLEFLSYIIHPEIFSDEPPKSAVKPLM
tara:strand:- start:228 stop:1151 length:924 start_codon:yes stop_codon:yes gene_type:complete